MKLVQGIHTGIPLTKDQKQKIREAATIIDDMAWNSTAEGHEYWSVVHNKLLLIACQPDTCDTCGQALPQ
jgi:hypothetical protein